MVDLGSGLIGDSYSAIDSMHYQYHLNLRPDSYTHPLYDKSNAIMNMASPVDIREPDRPHADCGPRKRISMACGRCRKRKIRCSGDQGDGQPCSNCVNSNHAPCQYLRVNSCEAHYRESNFRYGIELARNIQARQTSVPAATNDTPSPVYGQDNSGYSSDPSAYAYNNSKIWNMEDKPGDVPYNLSPNEPYNPFVLPFRPSLPTSQIRGTENTSPVYVGEPETPSYAYTGNTHHNHLVYRPANLPCLSQPPALGTYQLANGAPMYTAQGQSSGQSNGQSNGQSSQRTPLPTSAVPPARRPLPSSARNWRYDSLSPRYNRPSQPSPSQSSPAQPSLGTESSPLYIAESNLEAARIDASPTIAPIYHLGNAGFGPASMTEIKIEPDNTADQTPRYNPSQDLRYQFTDTLPYRGPTSGAAVGGFNVNQNIADTKHEAENAPVNTPRTRTQVSGNSRGPIRYRFVDTTQYRNTPANQIPVAGPLSVPQVLPSQSSVNPGRGVSSPRAMPSPQAVNNAPSPSALRS